MSAEIVPDPQEARERLQAAQEALIKAAQEDNVHPELGSELMDAATQALVADSREAHIMNAKNVNPSVAKKVRRLLSL